MKFIELQKRRAELRDAERDVVVTKRELVPLTTGLIQDVKKRRVLMLRNRVKLRQRSAVKIQSVWRMALVRSALYDEYKEYWTERYDLDISDKPYYYNTETKETVWTKPVAYFYFGEFFMPKKNLLAISQSHSYSQSFSNKPGSFSASRSYY